jgi:glycosyltransferase involved in cell wall biosynthesis
MRRRFVYSSANVVDFDFTRLERRRRNVWLFHLGVRLASEVVVQTQEQVALCRTRFGRRPVLIKSVATPAPSPTRPRDAFLWVGRLVHYKRPEDFLRLAEALREARFRMVAVAAGGAGAELEAGLRERAAALGNLELLEPRPHEHLLELMESAVAIVNTAEYEGMPNIFLEGWARGVPALSLLHDPDGVIERERIGAFADGDFKRFVAAARDLWERRRDPGAIAERCRDYIAAEHDPEVVLDQWIDALGLWNSGSMRAGASQCAG